MLIKIKKIRRKRDNLIRIPTIFQTVKLTSAPRTKALSTLLKSLQKPISKKALLIRRRPKRFLSQAKKRKKRRVKPWAQI